MSKLSLFVLLCFLIQPLVAATTPQQFIDFAAQTDMAESHLGQMAHAKSQSLAVKEYGRMLDTDHVRDYNRLTAVAQASGLHVPQALDARHLELIASLQTLKGQAFDRRFAQILVAEHEGAIATYRKQASQGPNAGIRDYAKHALSSLQSHLTEARTIERNSAK